MRRKKPPRTTLGDFAFQQGPKNYKREFIQNQNKRNKYKSKENNLSN